MTEQPFLDLRAPLLCGPGGSVPNEQPRSVDREARFKAFSRAHPEVERELVRLARRARRKGANRLGIRLLWERMRWEFYVERGCEEFKLNNDYTRFYARRLMARYADLEGLFETRGGV